MKNIVICGYDRSQTEAVIALYAKDAKEFSSIYINDGVHREDRLLCHLRVEYEGNCPYIFEGRADAIRAKHWEDACRYLEWIRDGGTIVVDGCNENEPGNGPMKEYLLKQESAGFIKVVYPGRCMV